MVLRMDFGMLPKDLHQCHSEGCLCPRNLLFSSLSCEKQIPRFARNDNGGGSSTSFELVA